MKKFKTKQGISLLLVLVMLLSPVLQLRAVAAEPVTEQDSVRAGDRILWESDTGEPFAVEMQVDSRWGTSYHATFTIRNTGDKVIDNWYLEFASDDVIENIWNASVLQNEDGVYLVRNAQWNQDIAVGGSVSFGFTACCGSGISLPDSFRMPTAKLPVEETAWSCEYSVANEQQSSFYNASFVIRNNREEAIEDWIVEFEITIAYIFNSPIRIIETKNLCFDTFVAIAITQESTTTAINSELHRLPVNALFVVINALCNSMQSIYVIFCSIDTSLIRCNVWIDYGN